MRYIYNDSTEPYFNLALEEYFLKQTDEEYFILWRNEPCIVVGKNQNTLSEIHLEFVKERNIKVVRRLTGGGAVFHDLGNINFTFIVNDESSFNDFKGFVAPIIGTLKTLGIDAEFSGRNDMLIEGKKFSGNAQCKHKSRVMHHGTLLFSSNMNDLSGALKPKDIKFSDKSVKSVASRVTNISEHLANKLSVLEFKDEIFRYISSNTQSPIDSLTQEEIEKINRLRDEKYSTWEWNFGNSPKYSFYNEKRFAAGTFEVHIDVLKGIIKDIKIFGDFFGKNDISELEASLKNISHEKASISKALSNIDISKYITNITLDELISLLIE